MLVANQTTQTFMISTIFVFLCIQKTSDSISCDAAKSCFGQSIRSTDGSGIACNGYRSCEQSLSIAATGGGDINCDGSYACFNSTSIHQSASSYTRCRGLFSCANVDSLYGGTWTLCYGERSCLNSNVTALQYLRCSGDRSCEGARITTYSYIELQGTLAALNAVLYNGDSAVTYGFRGAYSGYNATVNCLSGQTCSIVCYGNGCNGLKLKGDGTFSIGCSWAEKSDACPSGYEIESTLGSLGIDLSGSIDFMPHPLNLTESISTYENSFELCVNGNNSSNGIICDDSYGCQSQNLDSTSGDGILAPICCIAGNSCYGSSQAISISAAILNDTTNEYLDAIIRCDGYYT